MNNDTTISHVEIEGDETSDENLMIAHLAGDGRAFPLLVERYRTDLHRYLQRFLGSASAADDVFQETFLQIYLSASTFDVTRTLRPWLYTIASNKARDWYRHKKRRAALSLDKPMGHGENEFTLLDVVAAKDGQPGSRPYGQPNNPCHSVACSAALGWGYMKLIAQAEMNPVPPVGGI